MRIGKLTNEQLERLILNKFTHTRDDVKCSPHVGVDCAAVDIGDRLTVLSTDPITGAKKNLGRLTVHVSCNDAAAAGAEPVGLLVTLLAPPDVTEQEIGEVADDLALAAKLAGVDIIGGHTEVSDCVTRMITCATVVARCSSHGIITPSGMREGDDLVLTKHAGLEGAAVIAADMSDRLASLSDKEISEARSFIDSISVVKEGLYAADHGAHAMHDVTEGGIMGAAWEMAFASGLGIVLDKQAIPVHPITQKICSLLGADVYRLMSSGCMLIACENGEELAAGLANAGVSAKVIGKAVSTTGVYLTDGESVDPPEADELYKLL